MSAPENTVKRIVAKVLGTHETKIAETTALVDLGMDSLKMVELIVALEGAYEFSFSEENLVSESFETLQSVRKALEDSRANNGMS